MDLLPFPRHCPSLFIYLFLCLFIFWDLAQDPKIITMSVAVLPSPNDCTPSSWPWGTHAMPPHCSLLPSLIYYVSTSVAAHEPRHPPPFLHACLIARPTYVNAIAAVPAPSSLKDTGTVEQSPSLLLLWLFCAHCTFWCSAKILLLLYIYISLQVSPPY